MQETTEETNILCREVQRWGLAFRLLLVIPLAAGAALAILAAITTPPPTSSPAWDVLVTACPVAVLAGIAVLVFTLRLETQIRPDGIYVRFQPFHRRFRAFKAEDLSEFYARKYRPLLEYGGWGIRCGWRGGRAYNISGNRGLQLVFKTGKRLLIGSKKPDELEAALRRIAPQI